jgi:hypothetical protein
MKDDRPIWLTSLADADRGAEPSDAIELRLQAALRRQRISFLMRRSGAIGIAAALVVGLWFAPKRVPLSEVEPVDESLLEAMNEAADLSPDDDALANDFIPTKLASEQPLESVRMVRVSLPGGALARYGVPASEISANGSEVTADLLVGQDGIARAIRVVK